MTCVFLRCAYAAAAALVAPVFSVGLLLSPQTAWAQQTPQISATPVPLAAKRPITHDVYDGWRSIQGAKLSKNGTWAVYALVPQDGDGELIARRVDGPSTEWRAARGRDALFSADGNMVLFTVAPTKADRDKAKKAKTLPTSPDAPKNGLGILTLATGKTETVERVKRWSIGEDGGRFVAYILDAPVPAANAPKASEAPLPPVGDGLQQARRPRRAAQVAPGSAGVGSAAPATRRTAGGDLVIRDLETGKTTIFPDVIEFGWDKNGKRLWFATTTKDAAKSGVFVWEAGAGDVDWTTVLPHPVLTSVVLPPRGGAGDGDYRFATWDEKGEQLAFLAVPKPAEKDPAAKKTDDKTPTPPSADTPPLVYTLYRYGINAKEAEPAPAGLPAGMTPSENGNVFFSKKGDRLFFSYAAAPKPKPTNAPPVVDVDIWSSRDPLLQPMQKLRADNERKRSFAAVWNVNDKKVVPLGAPDLPDVQIDRQSAAPVVLATNSLPYQILISWEDNYRDLYAVNLQTGQRHKLLEKHAGPASLSPGGKFLLYFKEAEGHWYALATDGKSPAVNLTEKLPAKFADETDDHPDFAPAYGAAGWTNNDKSVLLYDRYDAWELSPDGKTTRRMTNGREKEMVFRYTELDPDAQTIPTNAPLLFTALNDTTKATGLYRLASLTPSAEFRPLVMQDKLLGGWQKAKNADRIIFTAQKFDEYPNLWTTSLADPSLVLTKISDANPQQAQFVWGKSELISYQSADGKPLRAILTVPENFDPTKKYPLIVNIYEKQTDRLYNYQSPAPGTSINISRYVSNGYVVLRPDIVYTPGYPGESALKCVLPAIANVEAKGFIDSAHIGIQGHSWGAYQIAYLVTHTNRFRAVEAGAAVADMVSAYGGIRWESGQSRALQYEKGQSRIGSAPWLRPLQFIENSPIFWADKVQTPYLTIHNDADGAVPWYQGIEFFIALRRLNKEAYLFDYNGEAHNLTGRDNQKHWTVHMAEYFDHYLLGKPRPDWMDKGVPYLERGTRDLSPFYHPAASTKTGSTPQTPGEVSKPVASGGQR